MSSMEDGRKRRLLFSVDRYGWTWVTISPSPVRLRRLLVEAWAAGDATEYGYHVPERRPLTV